MYLFQVLPLLPWNSEFSKIMIIMYFGHRLPMNSHIRGHLLSAKMALLHLSANIPHVGTQKEKLGLKWPKHYRCAWPLMHYPQTILIYILFYFLGCIHDYMHCNSCIIGEYLHCNPRILAYTSSLWETHVSYVSCLY